MRGDIESCRRIPFLGLEIVGVQITITLTMPESAWVGSGKPEPARKLVMAEASIWDILRRASTRTERVGYLEAGKDYPRGEISELAFERFVGLVKHSFIGWCGYHYCDLDPCGSPQPLPELRYEGLVIPTRCDSDILVPSETVI